MEIIQVNKTVQSAYELQDEINECDIIAIVAPINLQQQFIKLANGKPVIMAVNDRVLIKQVDGTEDKAEFRFVKWEQLIRIDIVKEDFMMSGSGTSKGVADKLGINSVLYDLNPNPKCGIGNWNALKNDVEDSADLIFFHPPYHDIIKYSGNMWGKANPDDLSRCENYNDFIEKLNFVIQKLYMALRKDGRLAILVGDIRSKGEFHSMQHDMMKIGDFESFIVKGQFNCVSDSRTYKKPFIPIVTEYMLVFHKNDPFIIDFSKRISRQISMKECDSKALTWHHLIRMSLEELGGSAKLSDLADFLKEHPKAKKNPHYRERIRATVYEHKDQYKNYGNGVYGLIYKI